MFIERSTNFIMIAFAHNIRRTLHNVREIVTVGDCILSVI